VSKKTIFLAVFLTVGLVALLVGVFIFAYPRIKTWMQVMRMHKVHRGDSASMDNELNDLEIEKGRDMEVNTAAGRFIVRM